MRNNGRGFQAQIANCLVATFISNSPAETEAIARQIAEDLVAGYVLALTGEIGRGKNLFPHALRAGLPSAATVTSPTFTIVHEYQGGRLPVYHFDFFRMENRQSAVRLGLEDYFFGDGVSVIEWADRFPDLIPEQARWISLEIKSQRQRIIPLFHHDHANSSASTFPLARQSGVAGRRTRVHARLA